MQRSAVLLIPIALLAACEGTGASYEPKFAAAPNPGYEQDLQYCRDLAKSEKVWNAETRTQALLGAAGGALVGALDGDLAAGAIVGGAAGATSGALDTRFTRKDILLECLRLRGQPVAG